MLFLALVLGTLLDPIALAGYVLAGAVFKRLEFALPLAVVWAVGIHAWISVMPGDLGVSSSQNPAVVIIARMLGATVVASIVWLIARQIRKHNQ